MQQPVAVLRSALSGKEQMQASHPERRKVSLDVSALARGRIGGGYMDMLGRLLMGGIHAVRLYSWSPNWHLDAEPQPGFNWLSMTLTATATVDAATGMGAYRVTNLPPGYPLICPGERFTVGGIVWQAVNMAVADDAGIALIRVIGTPALSGTLSLDGQESAAFRPDGGIPVGDQAVGADWTYSWTFTEVFADEVGGFVEIDPWT
ncbi:hypothetical protein D2T31_04995 [Sinirhodobacter populi]|uniref:Uncharacterized protein n=1 Tax=Paenirhodobacter populi TaxID=2306993 RepID=A0A443KEY6_9RHOB|nr:hypothetical protein [Sinirhodobacter populi]RWR31358.1 hypothetical protein D2T31_04995 [Sinirhodobacter populi]